MIIANPIYDVVFKYLLEDIEIAKELLATILDENITHISLKPQETAVETANNAINILRFDFIAIIKNNNGETKKVLIELQRIKQMLDVMRFRRYLGDNYRKKDDTINEMGKQEKKPLPIITIYFLGFSLENLPYPIIKIDREYKDLANQCVIKTKEPFIELLTHDAYFIQLKYLKGKTSTKLENILQVFSQQYETENKQQLDFKGDLTEPLTQKIVNRLGRAIANEEMRNKMDMEDELEFVLERELNKKDNIIAQKELELAKEKQNAEQERQNAEQERQKNIALQKEIEALKQQLKK